MPHPFRLRLALLAGAGALLGAAACKDPIQPPLVVTDSLAGSYLLRTVNGFPPPQIVDENGDSVASIVGGVVIIRADSSFLDSMDVQFVIDGVRTDSARVASGFIATQGNVVFFYPQVGAAYAMIRDDNTLTQDLGGDILVYRK